MATKQQPAGNSSIFGKENYTLMAIGIIVMILGFILMAGGKSADPAKFLDSEVYSARRITLAPAVIIAGFVIEIFAIMRKPKKNI